MFVVIQSDDNKQGDDIVVVFQFIVNACVSETLHISVVRGDHHRVELISNICVGKRQHHVFHTSYLT